MLNTAGEIQRKMEKKHVSTNKDLFLIEVKIDCQNIDRVSTSRKNVRK